MEATELARFIVAFIVAQQKVTIVRRRRFALVVKMKQVLENKLRESDK